jgi:hypothetical protein
MNRLPKLIAVTAAAIISATASGCTAEPAHPDYTPVADEVLFEQVRALPHITRINTLMYLKKFGAGNGYRARIDTDGEIDPNAFLDRVFAILYQGKCGVEISITITAPTKDSEYPIQYSLPNDAAQRERYGAQPGTGLPPADKPLPVAEGWIPPSKW